MYTLRKNQERPGSGIYFEIFEKHTIINEHPVFEVLNTLDSFLILSAILLHSSLGCLQRCTGKGRRQKSGTFGWWCPLPPPSPVVVEVWEIIPDRGGVHIFVSFIVFLPRFEGFCIELEAKTKSGSFLAESCGRAWNPPTAPTTQPKVLLFFDAAPKQGK